MNKNPVIIIPGLGQSKLVLCDADGNKIKNAWPFEIDAKAILDELKGSIMKLMLFRKDAGFSDRIAEIVREIAEPFAVKTDGTSEKNVKPVEFRKPLSGCTAEEKAFIYKMAPVDMFGEKLSEDRLFYFSYNFLGDITDIAAALDGFVSFVKEVTGCEKADFLVLSTGGAVLKAYLRDFSVKSDIERIVCAGATLDGSSIVADILENKLRLDNPAELLSSLGGKAASLSQMTGIIPPDVMDNIITKSMAVLRQLVIDNCTSIWANVPSQRFDGAVSCAYMSDALREKVTALNNYHNEFVSTVDNYEFYMLAGNGRKLPVVCESENTESDGLVDVSSATLGKTGENVYLFGGQSHDSILYNDSATALVLKIFCGEDISCYPHANGARSVKKLKNELLPVLKNSDCAEKDEYISKYENLIGAVIVTDDSAVKALEGEISAITSQK